MTLPIGLFLLAEVSLAVLTLIGIWPKVATVPAAGGAATVVTGTARVLFWTWHTPSPDALYLVAVLVIGALGASVHALTSFSTYVGNRAFTPSWRWWYVVRLPVGSVLAVILYFVLRGGLLSVGTGADAISPYGIGAVAGLAGMFSKQAIDKLDEVFRTLFATSKGGDASREDKLGEGVTVTGATPSSLPVRSTALSVGLVGTGFSEGMTVTVGGADRAVSVTGPTAATVTLLASDVAAPGVVGLSLGTAAAPVRVRPRVDKVDVAAGGGSAVVSGAGFVDGSAVQVDGDSRAVTARSATSLTVTLDPADTAGGRSLVVVNPDPAGGPSDPTAVPAGA